MIITNAGQSGLIGHKTFKKIAGAEVVLFTGYMLCSSL